MKGLNFQEVCIVEDSARKRYEGKAASEKKGCRIKYMGCIKVETYILC